MKRFTSKTVKSPSRCACPKCGAVVRLPDDLPGVVEKLNNTKDPGEALGAIFGLKSFQTLAKVQEEFKKKGYKLDLNSGSGT